MNWQRIERGIRETIAHIKIRTVPLAILAVLMTGSLAFQNCGNNPSGFIPVTIVEHNPPPSPFVAEPVGISDDSFGADLAIATAQAKADGENEEDRGTQPLQNEDGEDLAPKGLPVTLVVSNLCARERCEKEEEDARESLACHAIQDRVIPKLKDSQQYYPFKLPRAMAKEDIREWIRRNEIDKECLIGIANERVYQTSNFFNDTHYADQRQYMDLVKYDEAQTTFSFHDTTLPKVVVGVVDTGAAQVDELENVVSRIDMRFNANKNQPDCGPYTNEAPNNFHGSFVSGIIGAKSNNSKGIVGIAGNAQIRSYTVGNCRGQMYTSEIANAITAAAADGVEVLNLSLGSVPTSDVGMRNAVITASVNAVVVTAAGNDSLDIDTNLITPANLAFDTPGVITVAAVDQSGNLASFSNYGRDKVELAAPGVGIVSIAVPSTNVMIGDKVGVSQGTSFSAPMVAGAAAIAIGQMKKLGYFYNPSYIEQIVVRGGTRSISKLNDKVNGSRLLDFDVLARSLVDLSKRGEQPRPLTIIGVPRLEGSGGSTVLRVDAAWNIPLLSPDSRIGAFDISGGCNYSAPCMLQDFSLPMDRQSGTVNFTLTRNDLAPTMADPADPTFGLKFAIAVYRKVKGKNTFVVESTVPIDIRAIDRSSPASPLLGKIDNVRHDMQFLYINGYACVKDNNAVAKMELLDMNGVPIPTRYGYAYDLMIPHGSPIDQGWAGYGMTYVDSINIRWGDANSHLAGLEGSPTVIKECQTLTGAHNYELIVPLWRVKSLAGRGFKVRASLANKSLFLKDADGRENFVFPETNQQVTPGFELNLARSSVHSLTGSVCSDSPSPITVEVSFSSTGLTDALRDGRTVNLQGGGNGGFVNLATRTTREIASVYPTQRPSSLFGFEWDGKGKEDVLTDIDKIPRRFEIDGETVKQTFGQWFDTYPVNPNMLIKCDNNEGWDAYINATYPNIRSIVTGLPLELKCVQAADDTQGAARTADLKFHSELSRMSAIKTISPSQQELDTLEFFRQRNPEAALSYERSIYNQDWHHDYWDYLDVGEPFSTVLVGYPINPNTPMGAYIMGKFKVKNILREVKKFETPLGNRTAVLRVTPVESTQLCSDSRHRFAISESIDIQSYREKAYQGIAGFFQKGNAPNLLGIDMPKALGNVPYTVRVFQDGKLILHAETKLTSTFKKVDYPFQKANY